MSYSVWVLRRAQKELARLPKRPYEQARERIRGLAEDPRGASCRKLTGREGWRLRVGDYRVVYEIDDAQKRVTVLTSATAVTCTASRLVAVRATDDPHHVVAPVRPSHDQNPSASSAHGDKAVFILCVLSVEDLEVVGSGLEKPLRILEADSMLALISPGTGWHPRATARRVSPPLPALFVPASRLGKAATRREATDRP